MLDKPRRNTQAQRTFVYQYTSSYLQNYYRINIYTLDQSSYNSQVQFDIIRTPTKVEQKAQAPPKIQNPYVYKPKSYSSRRYLTQDEGLLDAAFSIPSKKLKKEVQLKDESKSETHFKIDAIREQTGSFNTTYFSESFFDHKQDSKGAIKFLLSQNSQIKRKKNPMLKSRIDIVSNKNQKLSIVIHDALLHANMSQKTDFNENFQQHIPNPYNIKRRDHYLTVTPFQKDYKSGYAPIQLQMQNADPAQDQIYNGGNRSHFIRKKQSTLSLPRSCGVSYIKPSESTQGHPYTPLQPLIFQCSSIFTSTNQETAPYMEMINNFVNICLNCTLPYIKCEQNEMRRLLLGEKIGEVGWVNCIENLWPCFADGYFFLILIGHQNPKTDEQVWESLSKSIFKVGMLIKKSTSGRKAFFKSIGIQAADFQNPNDKEKQHSSEPDKINESKMEESSKIREQCKKEQSEFERIIYEQLKDCRAANTLSLRLETYVEESQWKNLDTTKKAMMFYLTISLKQNLEKRSLAVITRRMYIAKSQKRQQLIQEVLENLRKPKNSKNAHKIEEQNQVMAMKPEQEINQENLQKLFIEKIAHERQYRKLLAGYTENQEIDEIIKKNNNRGENNWEKGLKLPLYYISTRDSFAFDLIEEVTEMSMNGRNFKKIRYYFDPNNLPTNYNQEYRSKFPKFDVGVTCYHGLFSDEELRDFENNTFITQENAFKSKFLQMTVQPSITTGKIKRTKFFFGYRYVWTRCQLAEPGSYIGAGVRKDVTNPPRWTNKIVKAFVQNGIAEPDFINSIAINVYHDGKEGLAQHFDDAVRFKQPIFTLRLFSDARLSFGSQFYGFCNGAFIVPLPRGCICVMQENSYAANGVKHCVRPCDMTGKSAAVILRQMHHQVVKQAARFDEMIEFPTWLATLSDKDGSIPYAQQKRRESEYLLQSNKGKKIK